MSKGSTRRKSQVQDSVLTNNWERIFGGKDKEDTHQPAQHKDQQDAGNEPPGDNLQDVQQQ